MDISFGIIVVCIVAQVARTRQADVVVSCETFREDQTYGTCTCTVDSTALTAVNCAQSKRPVEKVTITSTDMNGIQYDLCVYDNYTTGSISFNERFAICSDSPRISSGKYTLEFQIPTNKSLFLNADVDCQPTCFGNSGYELQTSYSGIPVKFGKIHKAVAMHCQSTACKGKDPVNCTCTVSSDKCVQKNGVTEMIMLTKDMQSTEHELCVYSNYTTGTVSTQGSSTVCSDIPQNSGNNYTLDVQIPTDKTNFDNPVFKCILVCPEESPDDTSDGPLEISILFENCATTPPRNQTERGNTSDLMTTSSPTTTTKRISQGELAKYIGGGFAGLAVVIAVVVVVVLYCRRKKGEGDADTACEENGVSSHSEKKNASLPPQETRM